MHECVCRCVLMRGTQHCVKDSDLWLAAHRLLETNPLKQKYSSKWHNQR